jgi:hypothetical protein
MRPFLKHEPAPSDLRLSRLRCRKRNHDALGLLLLAIAL